MNSFLKIIGLTISIVGCVATTMVWINVPIVGEVKGISNPTGIIALGGFIFCVILYCISLMSEERGIYWFLLILSVIPLISGFYYYQNIQEVVQQLTTLSKISVFGISAGDYYDASKVIEWKNGFQITILSGGINLFVAFVLLVTDDTKETSKTINRTSISNQYQTPLKLEQKSVSNFDNEPYIQKLKELFELYNTGVIPNDIYEDEKQKIIQQQKAHKIKFENQAKDEFSKQKSDTSTIITEENPKYKDRPSYISRPIPQKKTIDSNLVFVIVACLLLIGFAVYSITSNENKSQRNELSQVSNDSIGLANNEKSISIESDSKKPKFGYDKNVETSLNQLKKFDNKYAYEVKLLSNPILKKRLINLIGKKRYNYMKKTWAVEGGISIENDILEAGGCEAHNCNMTNFEIVADLNNDKLYVGYMVEGKIEKFGETTDFPEVLLEWEQDNIKSQNEVFSN